jgi:hypothetical protein
VPTTRVADGACRGPSHEEAFTRLSVLEIPALEVVEQVFALPFRYRSRPPVGSVRWFGSAGFLDFMTLYADEKLHKLSSEILVQNGVCHQRIKRGVERNGEQGS